MDARALVCTEKQEFSLEQVTLPECASGQVAIRTRYTGVSIGTEFALVRNKISWGPYPICTGYQGTGVIEVVGPDVEGFSVGDEVYYRGNAGMKDARGAAVSCVAGTHCTRVVTNVGGAHGVAKIPPGADMETASMFVMPAVGLFGVDMSNPRMGETVVVYGAGMIGLGVVAACAHRGCRVIAIDIDAKRLELAGQMGADHLVNGSSADVETEVKKIAPQGADVVFESTGIPACIDEAIPLCKTFGTFVWQGNYGEAPVSMHFLPAHGRKLTMFFPCDDGYQPCRRAVVKNMASGALKWEKTITHRIAAAEAPAMFARINREEVADVVGVVIGWDA
jgi:2-desacetyl-2-hydroxyethyl bacteriochlorophyllide A dehydrogenase